MSSHRSTLIGIAKDVYFWSELLSVGKRVRARSVVPTKIISSHKWVTVAPTHALPPITFTTSAHLQYRCADASEALNKGPFHPFHPFQRQEAFGWKCKHGNKTVAPLEKILSAVLLL